MPGDQEIVDFAVENYLEIEKRFLKIMEYIPCVDANMKVISPKFVPIIMDACSLIESILKEISKEDFGGTFRKYSSACEKDLSLEENVSLFLSRPFRFVQPYKLWTQSAPPWWNSYNKLKHDRLNSFAEATYESGIDSLVALHQVICKSRLFTANIIERGWINPNHPQMGELIAALVHTGGITFGYMPCESALVVSPLEENFVKDGWVSEDLEWSVFSDRVKILLSMSGY